MKRGFRFIALLIVLTFISSPCSQVFADPQPPQQEMDIPAIQRAIIDKQLEVERVKAEIKALDVELEIAIEAYLGIQQELEKTQRELQEARYRLEQTQREFDAQKDILNRRISNIYKHGDYDVLEILLNTKSFTDLLVRLRFLIIIGQQDADILAKLRRQKEKIRKIKMELEALKQEQLQVRLQLEAKKTEIENKLAEREQYLANLNAEIQRLIQEEDERKAREQRELLQRLLQLGINGGITIEPGTVVHTALKYLGIPYLWAGDGPEEGFDCSGLVMYVFTQHGVTLPHHSATQFTMGTPVEIEELQPGDVVFFGNPVHHVGIYIGAGYFVHAPKTGDVIRITRLSERLDYAGARRFPAKPIPQPPLE
ncbi:MAG: NlpC/P60 family protein [Actinomycetota bacterium]|nr:NlpC/P60 family protein [Actinomycetota bacterium]